MAGTVQLFQSRLCVRLEEPVDASDWSELPNYARFLLGDRVEVFNGVYQLSLMGRTRQSLIAVVKSPTSLYFPQVPWFSPFVEGTPERVGTKVLVECRENGTFAYSYGSDLTLLCGAYEAAPLRSAPSLLAPQAPLYTRADVVDHTDLDTFTVDPATSVDFDDAISVVGNAVYVHIVDIATASLTEEEETRLRSYCQTLYLANQRTCHLLDAETAGRRLSLVAGEPRSVITVAMETDPETGSITSSSVYRSTITVKRRYTYEQVAELFRTGTEPDAFRRLHALTDLRSRAVNYRLALPSVRFTVGDDGALCDIVAEDTNDEAHSLVATAMIMANLVVSLLLKERGVDLPNRFHAAIQGLPPLETTIATGHRGVDSYIRVKRYARASYAVDERGHFGLGLTDYVHFTSPMRRYADVVVHRLLAGVRYVDLEAEVSVMNRQATLTRKLQDLHKTWHLVQYLASPLRGAQDHVVYIVGIKSRSGVYWFLPSLSLDGFAHISTLLPRQYWSMSESDELVGATTTIRVGDAFYATVESIDPATSRIAMRIHTSRPARA
jgi:ribonuclease R